MQTGSHDARGLVLPKLGHGVLLTIIAFIVFERLIFTFLAPPIGDEAYYWMWGQKLEWSYFDHPPLQAWLLRLCESLFGWNIFGLRFLTWFTSVGSAIVFWKLSKRLSPHEPISWFLMSFVIYLSSPMFSMMTVVVFPDHLLIFLCLIAGYCLLRFADRFSREKQGYVWLYAASIALGLAILTKYNAALFGIGGGLFLIIRRELRAALMSVHTWLAACCTLAMQAPVLIWNYQQGFASYKFHYEERWNPNFHVNYIGIPNFILTAIIVISPFLFPAIYNMLKRRTENLFVDQARVLALTTLFSSSLMMMYISTFANTNFYWNITGFALVMPICAGWLESQQLVKSHILYGFIITSALLVNNIVIPLQNIGGRYDWTNSSGFGWPEVAERIIQYRTSHSVGFVATTFYSTAAQLSFALHDRDVTALSRRRDQYDYWFDAASYKGQNALLVAERKHAIADLNPYFDRIERLETVPYILFGLKINEPEIYLGINFHGVAP